MRNSRLSLIAAALMIAGRSVVSADDYIDTRRQPAPRQAPRTTITRDPHQGKKEIARRLRQATKQVKG